MSNHLVTKSFPAGFCSTVELEIKFSYSSDINEAEIQSVTNESGIDIYSPGELSDSELSAIYYECYLEVEGK